MKFLKFISVVLTLIMLIALFMSCGGKNSGETESNLSANNPNGSGSRSPEEIQATSEVFDALNEMYGFYNISDFDNYLTFWDINEDEKAQMLENFKSSSGVFEAKYELNSVDVILDVNGKANVTSVSTATSKNIATGDETVIKETMYYVMEKRDGKYRIKSFSSGGNELISYSGDEETTAE